MINIAVINFKTIAKNFIKFIILIALVFGIMNIGNLIKKRLESFSYVDIVKNNISLESTQSKDENVFAKIISTEMPILSSSNLQEISKIPKDSQELVPNSETMQTVSESPQENITDKSIEPVPKSAETSIVQEKNLAENYNTTFETVKIKNETSFNLTQDILTPNVEYANKKDIIIFHTHTCESYTPTETNSYTPSGNFRTTDLNHSVAQVRKCITGRSY